MMRRVAVLLVDAIAWTAGRLLETRLPDFPTDRSER